MRKKLLVVMLLLTVLSVAGCSKRSAESAVKNLVFTEELCQQIESVKYTRCYDYSYDGATLEWTLKTDEMVIEDKAELDELISILQGMVLESQNKERGSIGGQPSDTIDLELCIEDGTYVKVIFYYDYYYINVYNFDTDVEEYRNYREHKTYYVDEFTDSYWKLKDFIEGE